MDDEGGMKIIKFTIERQSDRKAWVALVRIDNVTRYLGDVGGMPTEVSASIDAERYDSFLECAKACDMYREMAETQEADEG
jgi:hypothetical protein